MRTIWAASVVVDAEAGVDGARLKMTAAARAAGMNARAPILREINGAPSCRDIALGRDGVRVVAPACAHGRRLGVRGMGAAGAGPMGPKRPGTIAGGTHGMPCARALFEFVGVPV